MKDMIRKSDVLRILETIRMETEMNRKISSTRKQIVFDILENERAKVNEIAEVEEAEPEMPEMPEVPIDCYLEPFMIGSTIGIERYHCRKCATLVEKNDKFCRKCGFRLGKIMEHRNMKWDTVRNVPVETEAC